MSKANDAKCIGYVGLPGAGKSHELVRSVIIPALQKGRPVYTNIPLHEGHIATIHNISDEYMAGLHVIPDINDSNGNLIQPLSDLFKASDDKNINVLQECVVVFDEIQTSYPYDIRGAETKASQFREWLSHHRHYSTDLHWGSQSETFVVVQIRRLTSVIYDFTNMRDNRLRMIGARHGRYRKRMYLCSRGEVDSSELLSQDFVDIDPRIYACYSSFSGSGGEKLKLPIPRHYRIMFSILFVLLIFVLPISFRSTYKSYKKWVDPNDTLFNSASEPHSENNSNVSLNTPITVLPKGLPNVLKDYDSWICFDNYCNLYRLGEYVGHCTWGSIDSANSITSPRLIADYASGADPLDARDGGAVPPRSGSVLPGGGVDVGRSDGRYTD